MALVLAACGGATDGTAESGEGTDKGAPETSAPSDPGSNAGTTGTGDFGTEGPAASDCSDASKDIYVVTNAFVLYRFHPAKLTFTKVGQFDCIGPKNPNFANAKAKYFFRGMAVSRDGHGWLTMQRAVDSLASAAMQPNEQAVDQALVEFDTATAACKVHDYEPVMTFSEYSECGVTALATLGTVTGKCKEIGARIVTNLTYASTSGSPEILYANKDAALISIDPGTNKRTVVGPMQFPDKTFAGPLAGTGDGRLLMLAETWTGNIFSPSFDYDLTAVDRTNAKGASHSPVYYDKAGVWPLAVTFWGGSLWSFGFPRNKSNGQIEQKEITVSRYDLATKTLTTAIDRVGDAIETGSDKWAAILGAANSTCAPLAEPK